MSWQKLVKTALLGTENGHLPAEVLAKLHTLGIETKADPAKILLEGAALFQQMEKGAFALQSYEGEIVQAEISENEQFCSVAAATHLELMLNGFYKKALPEFFHQLSQTNKTLLPDVLPAVFKSSLRSKVLWYMARPFLGKRGDWLLHLNADWRSLTKRPDEAAEPFAYLEKFKDAEEEAYFCTPERLKNLFASYQQSLQGWDWETENLLKIIDFRMNMLNAIAQ